MIELNHSKLGAKSISPIFVPDLVFVIYIQWGTQGPWRVGWGGGGAGRCLQVQKRHTCYLLVTDFLGRKSLHI